VRPPENDERRSHKECSTAATPHDVAVAAGFSPTVLADNSVGMGDLRDPGAIRNVYYRDAAVATETPVVEYRAVASKEA
jgi:hypothetical protein